MRTKLTFILMSMLLLGSCKLGSSDENTGELTVIKFEELPDSITLTDNFKDITCLQFEMTDNSILGEIRTILDADGNLVVLTRDYEISVFNKEDGKFIRRIGSVGEGPEEFITAQEICYDPTDKTILVFDGLKREFICYRLTGEFVKRFKTKGELMDIHSIVRASDGTMLASNNLFSEMPELTAYTMIKPDLNIENIDPFAPLVQPAVRNSSFSFVWGERPMSACGDELKFVKVLTDTLCSIKEEKVRPIYKLDFGKELLTKERIMGVGSWNNEGLTYASKNHLFSSVSSMFETTRYLVILPLMDITEGYYWIDKETWNGFHIGSTYYVDKELKKVLSGKTIIQIKGSTEKELISCFDDALTNKALIDLIATEKGNIVLPEKVTSAIENFDPEGNPFLIIYSN